MPPSPAAGKAAAIGGRLIAAILGGYAFSSSAAALLAAALPAIADLSRANAALAATMPAFLVYLAMALWALADRNLLRVYSVLFGGAGLMLVAADSIVYRT